MHPSDPCKPEIPTAKTADFYQAHFKAYHDRTFGVDPAPFLDPFKNYLPRGAMVLDVGCGSGRDLLWLKQKGFSVVGFERSAGLADLAREHAGCKVILGDFETFDFSTLAVDAVLMSGSLVHIPHARLPAVLDRILHACRPGSTTGTIAESPLEEPKYVYISLKEGRATKQSADGRIFYLWEKEAVVSFLEQRGLSVLEVFHSMSPLRPDETWLAFVAAIPY